MKKGNESDIAPPSWVRDKAAQAWEFLNKPVGDHDTNKLAYDLELDMLERLLDHAHIKLLEMEKLNSFLTDAQLDQQRQVNMRVQLAAGALIRLRRMLENA